MARTNPAAYRRAVAKFAKQCRENPQRFARQVALGMLSEVVQRSPVDTGRFRGNWQVQANTAPNVLDTTDPSGSMTIANGAAALRSLPSNVPSIYMLNHLPYSIELENGHSQQAPQGMVRLTVQRYRAIVDAVARELARE